MYFTPPRQTGTQRCAECGSYAVERVYHPGSFYHPPEDWWECKMCLASYPWDYDYDDYAVEEEEEELYEV